MAIADPLLAAAAIVHVFCGVAWIALYAAIELVVLRDLQDAKRLQDLGTLKNHAPRLSMMALMMGFATLVTGLVFLFLKFGTNLGFLVSFPEPRTIVAALGVVSFLLVFGLFVVKPRAQALGKRAAVLDPAQPLPDDFIAAGKQLMQLVRIQGAGLFLTLALMVIAVQGGL